MSNWSSKRPDFCSDKSTASCKSVIRRWSWANWSCRAWHEPMRFLAEVSLESYHKLVSGWWFQPNWIISPRVKIRNVWIETTHHLVMNAYNTFINDCQKNVVGGTSPLELTNFGPKWSMVKQYPPKKNMTWISPEAAAAAIRAPPATFAWPTNTLQQWWTRLNPILGGVP